MKTPNDFCVFILSHGRPNHVRTYDTLIKQGYTGRLYIVIDNEDKTADDYHSRFGSRIIVFDKAKIAETFDECDNFNIPRKAVVYARNACFEIAEQLGIKYFLQLDDDYDSFQYRFSPDLKPAYYLARNLDKLFAIVLKFYKSIPALTIAFGQGGDLLGGADGGESKKLYLKRKAMNTFFCSVEQPFKFTGRINEDVTAYVTLGNRGNLIFTMYNAHITQEQSQSQAGGMTDLYKDHGTYVKSFYTVMNAPSCVKVYEMGNNVKRLHHRIDWDHAVPVIMSEKHRKVS